VRKERIPYYLLLLVAAGVFAFAFYLVFETGRRASQYESLVVPLSAAALIIVAGVCCVYHAAKVITISKAGLMDLYRRRMNGIEDNKEGEGKEEQ